MTVCCLKPVNQQFESVHLNWANLIKLKSIRPCNLGGWKLTENEPVCDCILFEISQTTIWICTSQLNLIKLKSMRPRNLDGGKLTCMYWSTGQLNNFLYKLWILLLAGFLWPACVRQHFCTSRWVRFVWVVNPKNYSIT